MTKSALPSRRYGTRALWTTLPVNGVIAATRQPDRSLGWKLSWVPDRYRQTLAVRGRRIDSAAAAMRVLAINWGYSSTGRGSWATAVTFPTAGCWRLTGRSGGVTLTYVVEVVAV